MTLNCAIRPASIFLAAMAAVTLPLWPKAAAQTYSAPTPYASGVTPSVTPNMYSRSNIGVRGANQNSSIGSRRSSSSRGTPAAGAATIRSRQSIATQGHKVTNLSRQTLSKPAEKGPQKLTAEFTGKPNRDLCVLALTPTLASVKAQEAFVLALSLINPRAKAVDQMSIDLYYDADSIEPVSVDDHVLASLCAQAPQITVDRGAGVVRVRPLLSSPLARTYDALLSLQWKALRRADGARVDFGPDTAMKSKGKDALGDPAKPDDGVIGAVIQVEPPAAALDEPPDEAAKEEPLLPHDIVTSLTQNGSTRLSLYGPNRPIRSGEDFHVDIWLDNPRQLPIDKVNAHIAFDPNLLEVIDEDEGNWVINGVNVLDGPFHEAFPFDQIIINQAYDGLGEIYYGAGMQEPRRLPKAGALARIRFRPRATGTADIRFLMESSSSRFPTRVGYLGEDILGHIDDPEDGAVGCQVKLIK